MSNDLMIQDNGVLAKAELDIQISTAKAYPRKIQNCLDEATSMITMSQDTAESCFYNLPRKSSDGSKAEIKGPSVRLAEIIASAWGNIHAAARIVDNDGSFITAEGVCWDLEKNVKITMPVKRSIKTSSGKTYGADMQMVTGNAAAAIALRNAIFKVIPRALIDNLYDVAIKHAVGDVKKISSKATEVIARLGKMGVDKDKIFEYFKVKSVNDFTTDDIASLIGLGSAIKEKMISIEDAFSIQSENKNAAVALNDLIKSKKIVITEPKAIESSPMNESTIPEEHEKIMNAIHNAKSIETLHIAADLITSVDEKYHDELLNAYKEKEQQLS